jgi:two-component system sensor histidine kinase KdpD
VTISQRLYLAVVPAVVGVFAVAGLAYWGKFHRAAPEWVVVVAAVSAVGSLFLGWQNTRYVARRIERLAGAPTERRAGAQSPLAVVRSVALPRSGATPDEIDSIEKVVDHLSNAVSVAEAGTRKSEQAAAERIEEYAILLDEATAAVRHQLDETRMALHILAEGHFGALNENQDEMLAAARTGTETAETEMGRLQEIAQLDRGAIHARRESINLPEMLRSLRPQLESDGAKASVSVAFDVLPGLPRVQGDRIRLQRALELLLRHLVRHALPGAAISIGATRDSGKVRICVAGGQPPTLDADVALARRIVEAHSGTIDATDTDTVVTLPTIVSR